ncbi:hypothetical protein ACFY2K_11040 [Kitasatospora sp. NPDC001309]|uniref:hypothetical protein n=1 Tax=Kitasatospora sp. NPDC001309 TaxID=3364013 RepID=UPI0036A08DEE
MLFRAADPREVSRIELRALAELHVHRAVSPEPARARFERALHLLLDSCMALLTRHVAIASASAFRRSGRGI